MARTKQSLREERDLFIDLATQYEAQRGKVPPVLLDWPGEPSPWRGLCGWLRVLENTGDASSSRARERLNASAPANKDWSLYWWPTDQIAPRVRHLLMLAEQAHEEASR